MNPEVKWDVCGGGWHFAACDSFAASDGFLCIERRCGVALEVLVNSSEGGGDCKGALWVDMYLEWKWDC